MAFAGPHLVKRDLRIAGTDSGDLPLQNTLHLSCSQQQPSLTSAAKYLSLSKDVNGRVWRGRKFLNQSEVGQISVSRWIRLWLVGRGVKQGALLLLVSVSLG